MEKIGKIASGYVYYVSLRGVTGAASLNLDEVKSVIPSIRKHVHIPVCVGFGIRDGETAKAIGSLSDGVVIGSRLIQVLENSGESQREADLESFMSGIRSALDR